MAHSEQILEQLSPWQKARFREAEIPLKDAVASLLSKTPLVVAKPASPASNRWMLYRTDSDKIAILCHAGIWAWGSPLETGNFVPDGNSAPEGVPEGRIQTQPNYRCEVAYAFDTTVDTSIWDHIQALEDHAASRPNFNKGGRKRRVWQSGTDPSSKSKYVMAAKVFARRTPHNSRDAKTGDGHEFVVPYDIHPWILEGLRNFPELYQAPNPNRPRYYEYADDVIRKLEETNRPAFQRNDIVRVVFTVAFVVGGLNWYPEILPIELTRVGQLPAHLTATDLSSFPALSSDFSPLEAGAPLSIINDPVQLGKRKASEEPPSDSPHVDKKRVDTADPAKPKETKPDPAEAPTLPQPSIQPDDVGTMSSDNKATTPKPDTDTLGSTDDTEMADASTVTAHTAVLEQHDTEMTDARPTNTVTNQDIEMSDHADNTETVKQVKSNSKRRPVSTNKTKEAKSGAT